MVDLAIPPEVLWALEPEVEPKEQVVDGYLRQERSRLVS
jgi:hypothetical protein